MINLTKKDGEIFALCLLDNQMPKPKILETSHDWEYLYKKSYEYEKDADSFERYPVIVVSEEDPEEPDWYLWEEHDYMENRIMYDYTGKIDLEYLDELPTKERIK